MNGCAEVRGAAPELALEALDGPERAELLEHTAQCASCRSLVTELSQTVDALTLLVPEAEPPVGFADRTVAAIGVRRRRPGLRHRLMLAGAAAALVAVAVIASVAIVQVVNRDKSSGTATATQELRDARMIGVNGHSAGWAFAYGGRPSFVFLAVDYSGVAPGNYTVQLLDRRGVVTPVGRIEIHGGQGSWGGTIPVSKGAPTVIQLVDSARKTICEARLDGRATLGPAT